MLADIIRQTEAQINRRSSLFRGLSRMSRYHRTNISRNAWGEVMLETGDWFRFGCGHRRESPRKCALSADENINFTERSTMRYEQNVHAYGDSPSPIIHCLL